MREVLDERLPQDEPSFREVADALALGVPFRVYLNAADGAARFLHLGRDCLQVIGIPAEALLADAELFFDLVHLDDRERLVSHQTTAAAGLGPYSTEVRIHKPGGDLRWLRLTSARQPAPEGGVLLDGLIVDVTESKRLAEQLAEERQRLEQAIEIAGLGVFQWDRDDPDTVLWSEHQYAIYGVPPHVAVTLKSFAAMIHPDDYAEAHAAVRAGLLDPESGDVTVEHRIIRRDGAVRWVQMHFRAQRDAQGLKSIHGATLDVTARRDAEEQRRLQMREMAHRAKNALAVVMAMVQQAARNARSTEELADLLMNRLTAMARSQDLATSSEGHALALRQVIDLVIEPFDLSRFDIDVALDAVTIPGNAVIGLALLLHELSTNAVKYGALSNATGRVSLSLRSLLDSWVVVEWRERGGPPVTAPARQGFGTRLLGSALQSYGGGVTSEFAPEGFVAEIEMPVA